MRPALRAMSPTERWGYLLACMSSANKDYPAAQADADTLLDDMNDDQLRHLRETAQRLANAAGARIVRPIEGIDGPTTEQVNKQMIHADALDAIATAWTPDYGDYSAHRRITERAKDRLRDDWPELHRAIAAFIGSRR